MTFVSHANRSSDRESANLPDGIESLEGFVISLYQEVFSAVIYLINRFSTFLLSLSIKIQLRYLTYQTFFFDNA